MMKDNKSDNKNELNLKNEEIIADIEKQIAAMQWIQSAAVLTEAVLLTKLYFLKDNNVGEDKILAGIWVQTIGQLTEALGVTGQIRTSDKDAIFKAQKMAVTGDLLQSLGSGLQALGGGEILLADGEDLLIP